MYILVNEKNTIVTVVDKAVEKDNMILTTTDGIDCYYPNELSWESVTTIPIGLTAYSHKYENGELVENPDYVPYIDPSVEFKQLTKKSEEQSEKIEMLELLVAELGLMVGGGL